jgi:hypothetical protein
MKASAKSLSYRVLALVRGVVSTDALSGVLIASRVTDSCLFTYLP